MNMVNVVSGFFFLVPLIHPDSDVISIFLPAQAFGMDTKATEGWGHPF